MRINATMQGQRVNCSCHLLLFIKKAVEKLAAG